jgi:hypothetical protein
MYKFYLWMMLIGFAGVSYYMPTLKQKIVGILLLIVNFILFGLGR